MADKHSALLRHTEQFRDKANDLGDNVRELGKITREIAGDTMDRIGENATGYYKKGRVRAQKLEKTLESKIQENPVRSVLIAAGLGVVLGALWKSR